MRPSIVFYIQRLILAAEDFLNNRAYISLLQKQNSVQLYPEKFATCTIAGPNNLGIRLMRNLCSWSASLLDWGGFASLVCPSRLTATIRIVSPHSSLSACSPGLPACLPPAPRPALPLPPTALLGGGSGETGLVGCLVMEGGASQVDQETRTVHRG